MANKMPLKFREATSGKISVLNDQATALRGGARRVSSYTEIHEAAHGVAAHHLGAACISIDNVLDPALNRNGGSHFKGPTDINAATLGEVSALVVTLLVGFYAEVKAGETEDEALLGAENDLFNAEQFYYEKPAVSLADCHDRAFAFVETDAYWADILRVAGELKKSNVLTSAEIDAILRVQA